MDNSDIKHSKFLITLLFVCLLAVIMTVSASSAASEVYVNTTGNDTNGVGSADNPYASISNGIENTDNNGILYIGEGTFTGEKNRNMSIFTNITIQGAGKDKTFIDAEKSNSVFKIGSDATVILKDLTILNGKTIEPNDGGAIWNTGDLTVTDVNFINNEATSAGGAIANYNKAKITQAAFTNNKAIDGGAIHNLGELIITDSIFTGNSATFTGGAIHHGYLPSYIGILTIVNSIFGATQTGFENIAEYGGGLYLDSSLGVGSYYITGSTFTNNKGIISENMGSGIYINGVIPNSDSRINQNTFSGNNRYDLMAIPSEGYDGTVNARNNIWSTSNPLDSISGKVDYGQDTSVTVDANPIGGIYNTVKTVTLTSNDATATIYYTNDSSDPKSSVTRIQYTAPINISTNTTLKFAAVNSGNVWSSVKTEIYNVDTEAPTASVNPAGGTYSSEQKIVLTTEPDAVIYYTTDGSDPKTSATRTQYASEVTIKENTTLKFYAIDSAGNESPVETQNYTIDSIGPSASANPEGGDYYSSQNVVLAASEVSNIYYTLDGTDPTGDSTKYSDPLSIGTSKTLKFKAIDPAGNSSPVYTNVYRIYKSQQSSYVVQVPYLQVWYKETYKKWYKYRGKWRYKTLYVKNKQWYKKWYKYRGKWISKWRYKWVTKWNFYWLYQPETRWSQNWQLT